MTMDTEAAVVPRARVIFLKILGIFRLVEMTTRDMNGMSHSYYHELREEGAVLSQMGG